MKIKGIIWLIMIWLAAIQNNGKIGFLIFEIILYIVISKLITRKKSVKKNDEGKYKYETFDEGLNRIANNCKALNDNHLDDLNNVISEAKELKSELQDRIKSYDFREFENRNDVTWEQVENYLWIHCKYKGYQMWTEYLNHLVKLGKIQKEEIKLIFDKHRGHVAITPRPDLEAKENKEREEERYFWKKQGLYEEHYIKLENDEHWNYKANNGENRNIFKDLSSGHFIFENETSDDNLSAVNYEAYLKRKGYIC